MGNASQFMGTGGVMLMFKMFVLFAGFMVTMNASAYTSTGFPMANGEFPHDGACAVDRINGVLVPFNTKIILPDGRVLIVTDRFGAGHNNHLDIWMASENDCWNFGRRNLVCEVIFP